MISFNVPLLIATAGFAALFFLTIGVSRIARQRTLRRQVVERIQVAGMVPSDGLGAAGPPAERGRPNFFLRWMQGVGTKIENKDPDRYTWMRKKMLRAGIQWEGAPAVYWSAKILFPTVLVLLFVVLRVGVFQILSPRVSVGVGLFFALLGYYLPDLWLSWKTSTRKEKLFEGLPDALDLLVVCVEAGMGLDAAIHRVAKEMAFSNKSLSDEFKLVNLEMRAGKDRRSALRNLYERTGLDDVNSLVTTLIQTDRFGTSIAQALRVFADAFRTKRFQKAEEVAAKMPVKLIFPLILCIFPALFVVICGPAAIRIYQSLLSH
jgi:tight adherence protein C